MKLGIWVWNTRNDYNTGIIENDDTKLPMSFAFSKIGDTRNWYYDPQGVADLARIYTDQGIGQIPWYVGRGFNLDSAYYEGWDFGQRVAAFQGCGILDLEPYPNEYWQGVPGTPTNFVRGFEDCGGTELHLSPDARNHGINLDEWEQLRRDKPHLHIRYLPQAYWTEFRQDMERGISAAIQPLINAGVPPEAIWPVLPTYYVTGPLSNPIYTPMNPDDMERQLRLVADAGAPGASLWRRGFLSRETADRILAMPDIFNPAPPPPPPEPEHPPTVPPLVAAREFIAGGLALIDSIIAGQK